MIHPPCRRNDNVPDFEGLDGVSRAFPNMKAEADILHLGRTAYEYCVTRNLALSEFVPQDRITVELRQSRSLVILDRLT